MKARKDLVLWFCVFSTALCVNCFSAEPTIAKQMNMAFDSIGRLWITQSTQYPFPAKADQKGTDAVVVLEDKDHDGSFESSRVFANGWELTIGSMPVMVSTTNREFRARMGMRSR